MEVGGQRHDSVALNPGNTRYPLYRRLGGPQERSGRMQEISLPPGFDPRTVHPVASTRRQTAFFVCLQLGRSCEELYLATTFKCLYVFS